LAKIGNTTSKPPAVSVAKAGATLLPHVGWLKNTTKPLKTTCGKTVDVWELQHAPDKTVLAAWAKHFRNHYCADNEIDALRSGTGLTRAEYLKKIIFPDHSSAPGPSIRAGDFAEVLVADYVEYLLEFWVPRTRYDNKAARNVSTPGTDILGFAFKGKNGSESAKDTLLLFEAKAQFSGAKADPRLQDAVDGSIKDPLRKAESLNAIKRRFIQRNQAMEASKIERFQNKADRPYREEAGAAAVFSKDLLDISSISSTNCSKHPNHKHLRLIVISGELMMDLVHQLFESAANEA
jgi:hypothetical protein